MWNNILFNRYKFDHVKVSLYLYVTIHEHLVNENAMIFIFDVNCVVIMLQARNMQ